MKIVVIKFMHIGDVILITPLLKNLRHHFPEARIDVALNKGTEEMVTENPNMGKIHIHIYKRENIKHMPLFHRQKAEFGFAMEMHREKYDLVINLTSGDCGLQIAIFSGAKQIVSFPSAKSKFFNRFNDRSLVNLQHWHWVDINLDTLRVLGREPAEKRVELFWNTDVDNKIVGLLEEKGMKEKYFIHFHPVSRWLFKCIDDQVATNIIDFCQNELGIPIVITAAPVPEERKKVDDILVLSKTEPLDLTGKLSLKETAALNWKSMMYVGAIQPSCISVLLTIFYTGIFRSQYSPYLGSMGQQFYGEPIHLFQRRPAYGNAPDPPKMLGMCSL